MNLPRGQRAGSRSLAHIFMKMTSTHLQVVDRQLKPCYLLETCPRLQSLYLDWQFELSEPPFRRYTADWLSEMVRQREWATLAQKLTRLEVVFPAAHTPNAYR